MSYKFFHCWFRYSALGKTSLIAARNFFSVGTFNPSFKYGSSILVIGIFLYSIFPFFLLELIATINTPPFPYFVVINKAGFLLGCSLVSERRFLPKTAFVAKTFTCFVFSILCNTFLKNAESL